MAAAVNGAAAGTGSACLEPAGAGQTVVLACHEGDSISQEAAAVDAEAVVGVVAAEEASSNSAVLVAGPAQEVFESLEGVLEAVVGVAWVAVADSGPDASSSDHLHSQAEVRWLVVL